MKPRIDTDLIFLGLVNDASLSLLQKKHLANLASSAVWTLLSRYYHASNLTSSLDIARELTQRWSQADIFYGCTIGNHFIRKTEADIKIDIQALRNEITETSEALLCKGELNFAI